MEKYSIEDYLNLKNEIENIKSKKNDIEPQIEELQKQKSVLESNYNELQEHVVQIKALTELQRNLKLHQFAEKSNLKKLLKEHYQSMDSIENGLDRRFGIKSRQEIDLKLKKLDKEFNSLKEQLVKFNVDVLKAESKLKSMESNINLEDIEKQFAVLDRKNVGIRNIVGILKLKNKLSKRI